MASDSKPMTWFNPPPISPIYEKYKRLRDDLDAMAFIPNYALGEDLDSQLDRRITKAFVEGEASRRELSMLRAVVYDLVRQLGGKAYISHMDIYAYQIDSDRHEICFWNDPATHSIVLIVRDRAALRRDEPRWFVSEEIRTWVNGLGGI